MNIYVGNKELKELYIGNSSIKEVYVGKEKVRPSGWEFYYDFTNKTISKVLSDGWTYASSSGWSFSSNGITCTSSVNNRLFYNLGIQNFSNAKKITYENTYIISSGSWSRGVRTVESTSSLGNPAGHYISNTEGLMRIDIPNFEKYNYTSPSATGTKICKVVLDLVNKTGIMTYTGYPDISNTFNDNTVALIRNRPILQLFFSVGGNAYIKDVKITIE